MAIYVPIQRLGNGSFGEVWLCREQALGVDRAVKIIPRVNVAHPQDFYREAHLLEVLRHENVVAVHDAGDWPSGELYIAMEYLQRGTADTERCVSGFVPLRRARSLMAEALRGLDYLHSKQFIHGDLKPSNLMVGDDGRARLADFGLAQQLSPQGSAQLGVIYGTHRAPETLATPVLTASTDIYAAGVTLYRMLNGDSFLPPLSKHEREARIAAGTYPNRSDYQPFVPTSLRRVVNRALAVDPMDRFQTALDFRRALERMSLMADWEYESVGADVVWKGTSDSHQASIQFTSIRGRISLETRSGRLGSKSFRRAKLSGTFAPKEAYSVARHVMQSFVSTGGLVA